MVSEWGTWGWWGKYHEVWGVLGNGAERISGGHSCWACYAIDFGGHVWGWESGGLVTGATNSEGSLL